MRTISNQSVVLSVLFACLMATSCNDSFLDETVTTNLNEEVVFSDSAYAAGFLTNIYVDIGFQTDLDRFSNGGLQVACDESEFNASSSISTGMAFATGTVNPVTVTDDTWNTCYTNIRRCNKFLKLIGGTPMDESKKRTYMAEARFLRAWYYYNMLREYGGIPLIGDTLYDADDEISGVRNTYEECVDYIISECNAVLAENVLSPRTSGSNNGRINEACCYALISRVTLDAASPLHNGSGYGTDETKDLLGYPTYDKERWYTAYNAAKQALSCGDYALYEYHECNDPAGPEPGWGYYAIFFPADFTNYTSYGDFTYPNGAYQEIILEQKSAEGVGICQLLDPPSCGGNKRGGTPYYDLCLSYPMLDGKPIGESKYTYDPIYPAQNRDPRFNNSIIYDGSLICNQNNYNYSVTIRQGDNATQDVVHTGTPTGFYTRKMLHRKASGNWWVGPPTSRPLIRYAELLLNYAEAANEYYGPDFEETLGSTTLSPYEALKLIRRRAGIEAGDDGMYGLDSDMTQDEMREAIRLERRIELAFEGFRFYDERRWMIAEDVENQPMHGFEITQNGSSVTSNEFVVRNHVFRKAMYFFPLPYNEVVKTEGLVQNPYYD